MSDPRTEPVSALTANQEADLERLYRLARQQTKSKWGEVALRMLGPDLKRAAILAEVLHVIAANEEAAAVNMKRLADYAVTRVLADTPQPGSMQ